VYRYVVVDAVADKLRVALCDDAGRYHLAHCAGDLPDIRHELIGDLPTVGFAVLLDDTGKVFRLSFSHIHCDQHVAFDQLHPTPTA
jgi:hypothetical protein